MGGNSSWAGIFSCWFAWVQYLSSLSYVIMPNRLNFTKIAFISCKQWFLTPPMHLFSCVLFWIIPLVCSSFCWVYDEIIGFCEAHRPRQWQFAVDASQPVIPWGVCRQYGLLGQDLHIFRWHKWTKFDRFWFILPCRGLMPHRSLCFLHYLFLDIMHIYCGILARP